MAVGSAAVPHLRARDGDEQETTAVELFFDLVYVLAVTQLSHLLIDDLSWAGGLLFVGAYVALQPSASRPSSSSRWASRSWSPARRRPTRA
jgi:hypothetical protein